MIKFDKSYLGHKFIFVDTMDRIESISELKCEKCNLEAYFDGSDNTYIDTNGIDFLELNCEEIQIKKLLE